MRTSFLGAAIAAALLATACGSDAQPPLELHGKVFDLATGSAIAGASVVALDVNGAALSDTVTTGADGTYVIDLPVASRGGDGKPAAESVTLHADAATYQAFPGGNRPALPIDTGAAAMANGAWVVQSSLTDVALIAQPAGTGTGSIKGTVDMPDDSEGVLVVAETGGKGFVAIADRAGGYVIDDLAAADYTVSAYARGRVYGSAQATVTAGAAATADLHTTSDAPGTLTGTADIVATSGGSATSIVVMVESTFDEASGRGVVVPGLRAPDPGTAPNVSGAFTIAGVPPGTYVVLAAFENDGLVRDPDTCIAGTATVHVQVAAGQTVAAPSAFKVTGAITLVGPGVDAPEAVAAAPTLSWAAYPSAATYDVHVFDSFGTDVWDATGVTGTSVAYAGPFVAGAFYQYRVSAIKQGTGDCPISRSEDLRGVFYKQ